MKPHFYIAAINFILALIAGIFAFGGIIEPPISDYAAGFSGAMMCVVVAHLTMALNMKEDNEVSNLPWDMPPEVKAALDAKAAPKSLQLELREMSMRLQGMAAGLSYDLGTDESTRKHNLREIADRLHFVADGLARQTGKAEYPNAIKAATTGQSHPGTARRMDGGGRFG